MSASFTASKGSMALTPLAKSSWKTNEMRAPPASSLTERSLELPSMTVRNSLQNSVMIERTMLPCPERGVGARV